jgi:hypothetical protein
MVTLPWPISLPGTIQITKLTPDGMGGTDVEADFNSTSFKPFKVEKDVSVVGQDALLPYVEYEIGAQLHEALRMNQ